MSTFGTRGDGIATEKGWARERKVDEPRVGGGYGCRPMQRQTILRALRLGSPRSGTLAAGLVLGLGLGLGGCSPAAEPVVADVAQLAAHQPARIVGAHVVGRVDRAQVIELVLGMRLTDVIAVQRLVARQSDPSSADFHRFLTPAQFAATFAPSQEDYDGLAAELVRLGLTVTRKVDGRTTMSVKGPASVVESVFGTELLEYEDSTTNTSVRRVEAAASGDRVSARFYAPSSRFSLDALTTWSHLVAQVSGLDSAAPWFPHLHMPSGTTSIPPGPATPAALPGLADPADIRAIYNVNGALGKQGQQLTGAGETVAILGTGTPPPADDLKGFVDKYTLPDYTTHYTQVFLGGPNRDPAAAAFQEEFEDVLDADMVLGTAPQASVVHVLTAANAGGLFNDGIAFVINQVPQAHGVSVSFGTCERAAASEILQLNTLFAQAEAQGQTWFFSSGDNGTDGCQDGSKNGVLAVDWPASSPYVFGVGGTAILQGVEKAWNAGGGGQSELFPKPAYQQGVGPYPNDGARDVPDVAALAGDPGVATYFQGSVQQAEGTSAASPIWLGIWAMLAEARGHVGLPNAHERIYAVGPTAFRDIVGGENTDGTTAGYIAIPGFDLATGWGVPNLIKLVGALP